MSDFCMQIFLFMCKILLSALQVIQIPVQGSISTVVKDFLMEAWDITPSLKKTKKNQKKCVCYW